MQGQTSCLKLAVPTEQHSFAAKSKVAAIATLQQELIEGVFGDCRGWM